MEPKTPEDVYKSHLENSRPPFGGGQVDSARQNLAASFVNGFVNAAFGHDKLLMEDGNKWLYKNKEHGKIFNSPTLFFIIIIIINSMMAAGDVISISGQVIEYTYIPTGIKRELVRFLELAYQFVLSSRNSIGINLR